MTVRELMEHLEAVQDSSRPVAVTLSYRTGDYSELADIGTEGGDAVYLFPGVCLDGSA